MALYRKKAIEHRYQVAWGQVRRRPPGSVGLTAAVTMLALGSVGAILWLWV